MFKYTIESNGIMFNIKKSKTEIVFVDERFGALTWDRTPYNEYLVDCMVEELTGSHRL